MAEDKEKKYFDHGWPWYHWHFWPFSGFNNMFTQPLLFDDSLTLLQKVAMLWKKLYDLIQDYEKFKADFATWKAQVESALADLAQAIEELDGRLDTLEQCCDDMQAWKDIIDAWKSGLDQWREGVNQDITQINQTITEMGDISELRQTVTNQGNTISNHTQRIGTLENNYTTLNRAVTDLGGRVTRLGDDLTALTRRVSANEEDIASIQEQLNRLDIRLPLQIVDSTNFDALGNAWYNWLCAYADARAGNASGTCAGIWTRTDDFHPSLLPPDHSKPRKQLTIGKAGQNFTEAVLPLMLTANLTTPTTLANEAQVVSEVMQKITTSGIDMLYRKGLAAQEESYFHFTGLAAYPYANNLITFQTSYILFQPEAWSATALSALYAVTFDQNGGYTVQRANSIRQDVRLFMTADSTDCKLAVVGNELFFIVYNGVVVICFHAQNA